MEARWLKRKNEETGAEERFYPITHADAVVVDEGKTLKSYVEENVNEHLEDKNNPHGVTAEQVGAVRAVPIYHGANYNVNPNDLLEGSSIVYLSNTANVELWEALNKRNAWAYIVTLFFNGIKTDTDRVQIAIGMPYGDMATRACDDGTWRTRTYLPIEGGTLTGNLQIKKAAPEIVMTHTTSNRYLNVFVSSDGNVYFRNAADSNNRTAFYLQPETATNLARLFRLQKIVDGTPIYYNVFGEHNKPSGEYTGNGSSTERVINLGIDVGDSEGDT